MAFLIVGALGLTGTVAAVATFAINTVLSIGISKLVANRMGTTAAGAQNSGSRVQLPPATNNKLPVIYGSAFIGPSITDAKISTDQRTMWYVCAFNEVTDTTAGSNITFDELYYDNKLVTFDGTDPAKVIKLTTNTSGGGEEDTKIDGNLFIYKFPNGSNSGVNTGGQTAIQIMSDSGIPANQRWNQGIYTANGQSADMTNTAFLIVKVKYNQDAGTTQLGTLTAKVTNTVTKPGDVLKDYMLSERYGCGIPLSQIDTTSLAALNTYSDLPVYYTPAGGGGLTSQVRYRINGPIDTGQNCLTNLQYICDACDSWLQYSELTGKWKVVINQSYTEAGQTINDLYSVDSSNIVGGVNVNPIDLNATYNELEVQYPNKYIKDQTDYVNISLFTDYPSLLSENEPINKLTMQSQIINNFVQAKFIGIRRLLQSREDLIINFATDYSGIQTEAGDIIKVTLAEYGWTNKLFRVSNVIEEKYADGSLGARISAFEYNNSLYDDDLDITDFIPEDNTGLTDPNIIARPDAPTVTLNLANSIAQMNVTGVVPSPGLVLNLDFNVGTSNNSASHTYYTSISNADGTPLTANSVYTISATGLDANTYYWSVTARNKFVGVRSNASANSVVWPGPSVTPYDPTTNTGGIGYNQLNPTATPKELIGSVAFGINNVKTNTVTLPVAVTTGITNQPVYIDGANVGTNYYYPYYQGTSTTANGYLANSTASFTPSGAGFQVIENGDDNWYVYIYDNFGNTTNYPLKSDEAFIIDIGTVLIANVDSAVQIGGFYTVSTAPGVIYHDSQLESTYLLPANVPVEVNFQHGYDESANNIIDGGGVMIKNFIANTRVTVVYSKLELYKGRFT